jgi:hypothetical protein
MAKLYDVAVKTGSYTDKSGATKGRYENIGVMMEGDNGPYLMLKRTFNPAGVPGNADRDNIICSLFKPSDDQGARPAARAPLNVADDEIPF